MSGSSSRPTSVRGLYTPPSEEWVFLPPTVSPPAKHATPAPTHLPASAPMMPDEDDVSGVYGPIQLFAAEYFTTALGMPFEVGKTLLQIEYRPRRRFDPTPEADKVDVPQDDDQLDDPEDADMYFTDRLSAPSSSFIPPPVAETGDAGYLPDLHPSWFLVDDPEISRGNGVWGMIRRIRSTPTEGLPALWKSQLITTLHSIFSNLLQPHVHNLIIQFNPDAPSLDTPLTALPHPGMALGLQVASHLLTHLLLSPMEVIRTRLIAMPMSHSTTPSSVSLFRTMVDEEGGFSNMYFNSNLVIPSILEHTVRPLLTLSIPLLLERQFGLSLELSPITYSLCDLSLGLGSLLILLPIETVRKRLQLQARGNGNRVKTIVRTRPQDYVGVVEAIWRIATEETGVRRKRVMQEKDEGGVFSGIMQLYRGFGMAATAHLTVFGLGLVSASMGGRGFESQWKEI